MKKQRTIYLHSGSNLGDRKAYLSKARTLIGEQIGEISQSSHLYETEAWGNEDQPDFINQALEVTTLLSPEEVLIEAKRIEKEIGRINIGKWNQRIIDIDILFYGDEIVALEHLKIPHPFCHERMFVLVPLLEIAGDFEHPKLKQTIEELYLACKDPLEVILLD